MATKKEIEKELQIAFKEIGEIKPWYDKKFHTWIFEHASYPIGCEGNSAEEVIKKYPLYLKDFIEERLKDNLAPFIEKATKGHGGKRSGSGRPVGSIKEQTTQVRLPVDIAKWIKAPGIIHNIRQMIQTYKHV